jgi:hypothetical protein
MGPAFVRLGGNVWAKPGGCAGLADAAHKLICTLLN